MGGGTLIDAHRHSFQGGDVSQISPTRRPHGASVSIPELIGDSRWLDVFLFLGRIKSE